MITAKNRAWLQTFSGKKFYPFNPIYQAICIEDIAHSLSLQCRYNGHSKEFYSVAEHSVLMSRFYFAEDMELARYALLHDASEAYLSDIPRPLKLLPEFEFYRRAERDLQHLIYHRFGLVYYNDEPEEIRRADYQILCEEAMSENLMSPLHSDWTAKCQPTISFQPHLPKQAEEMFLAEFAKLFGDNYE